MKFDVIIGNPPYQIETNGNGRQAKPVYNLFVEQAIKLNPNYIVMITPSRWFTGGMGLQTFRENMMSDTRIRHIVDFPNSKDCFPGVSISGGVSYFLWDKNYNGKCHFTSINNSKESTFEMDLNEYDIIIRYKESREIISAINSLNESKLSDSVYPINVFDLSSSFRGQNSIDSSEYLKVIHSQGIGYLNKVEYKSYNKNSHLIHKYKVVVSRTVAEHANEPNKDGTFRVISKAMVLKPNEICTHSYLVLASFDNERQAINCLNYILTKTVRFLILQTLTGIDLSAIRFNFVPTFDFSDTIDDKMLYKKYNFSDKDIEFIEQKIRPMEKLKNPLI